MKQITYLISVEEEKDKQLILKSKMALIRDYNMGWFEVPASFKDDFENIFGIKGCEYSVCRTDITKEEINHINYVNWHKGAD